MDRTRLRRIAETSTVAGADLYGSFPGGRRERSGRASVAVDRRRPGRTGGGLRRGSARPQGHALRQECLARRQGGGAARKRLPLRHGADDPHGAAGPGAHLRRGRPQPRTTISISCGSTRNGAASSTTARRSTCRRTSTPWRRAMDRFAPGKERRRGLPALPGHLRPPARRLEPVLLLEAGGGSVRHHQHPRQSQSRRPCATSCPCAWARRSPAPSAPR